MSSGENPRKKYPKLCSESAGEPDLKHIGVDDGGALVSVVLQLGQKVTVSQ